MVKIDSKGVKEWDVDFGGTDFDFLYSLKQTTDGGYILGGYSSSNAGGDKSQDSKGLNDYWVVKTTPDGVSCNIATNLTAVNIGSRQVMLAWDSVPGAVGYLVSYKTSGSSEWTVTRSASNSKQLRGLIPGLTYQWSVKSICSSQQSAWSSRETFFTGFSAIQTVEEPVVSNKNFLGEVYPNPISQSATVSFFLPKASPVTIAINDMYGRPIKTVANKNFPEGEHKITFNRESLAAGIYLLQMRTVNGLVTRKLLVE